MRRLSDPAAVVASPMKIIQVLPALQGGGVERGTLEIAQYLTTHGHESYVVSTGGRMVQELEAKGTIHHQFQVAAKSLRSLQGVLQFRKLILQLQPDIVHVRSRIPGWVVELAYKSLPKRMRPARICTFHGFYSVNGYSAIMTHGERILAVSQTIAQHIQQSYGVPEGKIEVIYRGIDPTYFNPTRIDPEKCQDLRNQWQMPDVQTPVLLMPGRFTRLKGHSLLLEALAQLLEFPWILVFVGDHNENFSYTDELLRLADRLGIGSRLRFFGICNDMPLAYCAADLVLNVSIRPESFGRTAVEAMGMAKPVIVSGHGGALETIVADETGWYFSPNDLNSLILVLRNALLKKDLWKTMGLKGRQHVVEHFSLQEMCKKTLRVYQGITA